MNNLINQTASSAGAHAAARDVENPPPQSNTRDEDCRQMEQLIDQIARSLVDNPQQVMVTTLNSNHMMFFELRVAKTDIGKVIGKQGRTVQAIRTLLTAVSSKARKRMALEIIE